MMREQFFNQPSFIPPFEDYTFLEGKHVGFTGHKGVLGSIISKRLKKQNIMATPYGGDISDPKSLNRWFNKYSFDYFVHFAAIVPVAEVRDDPLKAYEVNAIGTYYICREIIKTQTSCWLFIASTSHIYKNQSVGSIKPLNENSVKEPVTVYGMTKLLAEQISIPILELYKIPYCIGRIFSFTSVTQKEPYLVPTLHRKIETVPKNGIMNIVNPDCIRDMVDAETVIDCVFHLAFNYFKGIINIGSGEGKRIIDIARHIARLTNKKLHFQGINEKEPDSLVADVELLRKVLREWKQK